MLFNDLVTLWYSLLHKILTRGERESKKSEERDRERELIAYRRTDDKQKRYFETKYL